MLSLLHIENIALIESAEIAFGPGFNALTGETGAGKSIVIDSIGAVMGERTSRDLIRTGAKAALVSAVFQDLPDLPWFQEMGIFPDENGELTISRQIQGEGKNLCRVGGRPCTVVQLKALGGQLLNIHGQHDGQQLLDESCHLRYLDSFGGLEGEAAVYRAAFEALTALRREKAALVMDEGEKARRIDSLTFQVEELERANLRVGEEEELTARRDLLRNSGKLLEAVEEAKMALSGDEDRDGALSLLDQAQGALEGGARLSEDLSALAESVAELRYAADDVAERVRDLREQLDFAPGELDELESRLDVLYRLKRKYGPSAAEMLEYLDRSRKELDEIQFSDEALQKLEKAEAKALKEAKTLAKALSAQRRKAAEALKERIRKELAQLDMPKVRFETEFGKVPGDLGLDGDGMDKVQFLMSANVGENLKPIQKVASGGELARIMLALKNVLAENEHITTLIFDEVDAGVSGRAAQKVAEKMAQLAQKTQVLCVTHLPQLAAMSDHHFSVRKGERQGRTYTQVELLDRPARRQELARLTGGAHVSQTILEGAEELLAAAEAYKQTVS